MGGSRLLFPLGAMPDSPRAYARRIRLPGGASSPADSSPDRDGRGGYECPSAPSDEVGAQIVVPNALPPPRRPLKLVRLRRHRPDEEIHTELGVEAVGVVGDFVTVVKAKEAPVAIGFLDPGGGAGFFGVDDIGEPVFAAGDGLRSPPKEATRRRSARPSAPSRTRKLMRLFQWPTSFRPQPMAMMGMAKTAGPPVELRARVE